MTPTEPWQSDPETWAAFCEWMGFGANPSMLEGILWKFPTDIEKYKIFSAGRASMSAEGIVCPFCSEPDFDLIGLKFHLENYCEKYKATDAIREGRKG